MRTTQLQNRACRASLVSACILAMFLTPISSQAVPIVQTGSCAEPFELGAAAGETCVTGILGLVVGSITYNVDMVFGSGAEVFTDLNNPDPLPVFWQNQAGAIAAIDAIVAALNANPTEILGAGDSTANRWFIDVVWGDQGVQGFDVETATAPSNFINSSDEWINTGQGSCGFEICVFSTWAVFTAVPEPGTLAMIMLGLIAGVRARRS